jgi:hypothetical protein
VRTCFFKLIYKLTIVALHEQVHEAVGEIDILGLHVKAAISTINRLESLGLQRLKIPLPKIVVLGKPNMLQIQICLITLLQVSRVPASHLSSKLSPVSRPPERPVLVHVALYSSSSSPQMIHRRNGSLASRSVEISLGMVRLVEVMSVGFRAGLRGPNQPSWSLRQPTIPTIWRTSLIVHRWQPSVL